MLDLGTIQYNVEADTTDLNQANAAIDSIATHANEAGQATEQLGKKITDTGNKAETASRGIANSFEKINAGLRREVDLYGQTGRAAILRYDIEKGALGDLTTAQKANLIALAESADQMDRAATAAADLARKEQLLTEAAQGFERVIRQQANAINQQFASVEANLARELALYGSVSRAATLRYDLERGALRNLSNEQKASLSAMASRLDAMDDANSAFVNGNNAVTGSMGRMRGMAQNVGWQLQDVVVQLQMGTNAAMVFSQQGSQLVGAWNPLAGAGIAIAGVLIGTLIPALFNAGKETEKMAENTKALIKELNDLNDTQQKVVNKGLTYSIADETKAYDAQAKAIENQINKIRQLNAENGKSRTVATGGIGGGGAGTMTFVVDNTKLLEDATRSLTAAQVEQVAIQRRITDLQDPSGSAKKIDGLRQEAEIVGKVGIEYWNLKAAQEGLTGAAKIEYVALGLLKEQREADKKSAEDAAKAKEKAAKDAANAAEKEIENEKRRRESIEKMTAQMQREADLFGVTSREAQVKYDILNKLINVYGGLNGVEGQNLLIQARRLDQMQDEIDLAKSLDAEIDRRLSAEKKAADDIAKKAKEQAEDLSKMISDGLMRGFEAGKGIVENFKDVTENVFKSMILKPSIDLTVDQLTSKLGGLFASIKDSIGGMGGGAVGSMLSTAAPYAGIALAVGSTLVSAWNKKQDEKFIKMTAEYKQGNQSMVEVLGDTNKKSQAIANGISLLEKNNVDVLDVNYGMLSALLDIREGLGNVAAGFSKTLTGSGNYAGMGITEGTTTSKGIDTALKGGAALMTGGLSLVTGLLGDTIGGFVDGLIGGISSAIYNKKKKVIDSGIEIIGGSLADLLTGATLQAFNYADIKTTKKVFGVTTSSKNNRKKEDLDNALEEQISSVFENAGNALKEASGAFGINFDSYVDKLTIKAQDLSLKGLTGDELVAEIESFFGATMDDWARTLLDGTNVLVDLQNVGESAFDTMLRLSVQTNTFNDYADKLNLNFNATGVAAVYASDKIGELSGGFDKLSQNLDVYYDRFFSDTEKFADSGKKITEFFDSLDYAVPTTRDAFKGIVEALDLTTEAGQKQFATLISVSGAVDKYITNQEKLKKQFVGDSYTGLEKAVGAQKKIIDAQMNIANKSLSSSRAVYDALSNTLKGLVIDSDNVRVATRRQARAELEGMLSSGGMPDIEKLNSALATISQPSEDLYSTFEDYAKDFYDTANTIKGLQDAAGTQVSVDEKNLAQLELQNAKYDEMLVWAKKQVDILSGVDVSVMSVTAALYSFANAVGVTPQSQDEALAALAAKTAGVPIDPNSPQAQQAEAARIQAETAAAESKNFSDTIINAMVSLVSLSDKGYKVIDKWDTEGIPAEREVV